MESVAVMRRAQSTLSHEVARAMGIADVLDDDADRLAASLGGQREMGADLETARAATARIKARDEADLWRVRVAVGVYALAVLYVWYMRVGRLLGLHWILGTLWRLVVGVAGTGSGEGHQDVGPSVDAHGEDLGGASGEEGSGESLLATAMTAAEEETAAEETAAEETATETSTTTEWTTTTETTPLLDGDVAEAAPDWAEHNHSSSLSSSSSSSLVWEAENDGWGSVAIEREPAATDAPTTTDLDTASSFETAPLSDAAVGENAEPRDDL